MGNGWARGLSANLTSPDPKLLSLGSDLKIQEKALTLLEKKASIERDRSYRFELQLLILK